MISVPGPLDALEAEMRRLRGETRAAHAAGNAAVAGRLLDDLHRAQRAWDELTWPPSPGAGAPAGGPLLPVREQVHQVLALLGAPGAPRLIAEVQEAFSGGRLRPQQMASLRRDEERSYRAGPGRRPYYLCPALGAEHLVPVRALIAIRARTAEDRIVGPLSPPVHFLTSAARIAARVSALEQSGNCPRAADRLLRRLALHIPGLAAEPGPGDVEAAARTELTLHAGTDRELRARAAARARREMDDAGQLFGGL
jgi:hypothetical protein